MRKNKPNLKDRFSNFEPDIDDSVIEKKWQNLNKIIITDNQSSKKNRFLTPLFFGMLMIIPMIFILNYYLNTNDLIKVTTKQSIRNTQNQSSQNINNTPIINTESSNNKNIVLANTYNSKQIISNTTKKNQSNNQLDLDHINNSKTYLKNTTNSNKQTTNSNRIETNNSSHNNIQEVGTKYNITKPLRISGNVTNNKLENSNTENKTVSNKQSNNNNILESKSTIHNNTKENYTKNNITEASVSNSKKNNPIQQSYASNSSKINTNEQDEFIIENINSIKISDLNFSTNNKEIINAEIIPLNSIFNDSNSNSKVSKFSIDISAGMCVNQNKLTQSFASEKTNLKVTSIGYSGSLGINYKLNKSLFLLGEYNYAKNQYNNLITNDKAITVADYVSNYTVTTSSSSVAYQKDEIQKQFIYKQNYTTISKQNHTIGLGIGSRIISANKLYLEASIIGNLKISNYNYTKSASLNSDTLYVSNINLPSNDSIIHQYNTTYSTTDYGKINFQVLNENKINFGITTKLILGYKISTKTDVFLRASYNIDLNENTVTNDELITKIKQNILLIHFGLRFKL